MRDFVPYELRKVYTLPVFILNEWSKICLLDSCIQLVFLCELSSIKDFIISVIDFFLQLLQASKKRSIFYWVSAKAFLPS